MPKELKNIKTMNQLNLLHYLQTNSKQLLIKKKVHLSMFVKQKILKKDMQQELKILMLRIQIKILQHYYQLIKMHQFILIATVVTVQLKLLKKLQNQATQMFIMLGTEQKNTNTNSNKKLISQYQLLVTNRTLGYTKRTRC